MPKKCKSVPKKRKPYKLKFGGCDEDCFHCKYSDCMKPEYRLSLKTNYISYDGEILFFEDAPKINRRKKREVLA